MNFAKTTRAFMQASVNSRTYNPSDGCIETTTKNKVKQWHELGAFVVGNAGGYDILTLNHLRGLVQARIIGATHKLMESDDNPKEKDVLELAGSDEIRLLLSLDTNEAIMENKSFLEVGGNSIRPVLDWKTRAGMLALQTFGNQVNLVDFITAHGPNACAACENNNCWHSNKKYSVATTGVDLTVLKDGKGADDTIARLPEKKFYKIREDSLAFSDDLLDGQISTSAIIKRIRKEREDA